MTITWSLCGFLLFYPIVVSGIIPVVGKGYPRPCDANAGVSIMVITNPSPRKVGGPPGFCKLAYCAGGHGIVTL